MRFLPPGGAERAFDIHGDPGIVRLDPRWHQAAFLFVKDGFFHILDGIDHLLFLLCLVIPFRQARPLLFVVTSFTVAHSITLIASAFDMAPGALWFPPLIETLIARRSSTWGSRTSSPPPPWRRPMPRSAQASAVGRRLTAAVVDHLCLRSRAWLRVFVCPARAVAVCGAASADVAAGVQRRRRDRAGSRAGGHVASARVALPLRRAGTRSGTIILSALVVHTAWHWLIDRGDRLRQYQFDWPAFDTLFLARAGALADAAGDRGGDRVAGVWRVQAKAEATRRYAARRTRRLWRLVGLAAKRRVFTLFLSLALDRWSPLFAPAETPRRSTSAAR